MNILFNIYNRINRTNLNLIFCVLICLICFFNASYLSSIFFTDTENDFKTGYYIGALNIKNGNGYTNNVGELITHWPPGYSIYLTPIVSSSLESSMVRIKIVNGLLSILWAFLLIKIFKKSMPTIPAFVPLGFAVLWPPMLAVGNPILSELLFATIITLSIYILFFLFDKKSRISLILLSIAYGVLFGFATLTKTLGIPIFLFSLILLMFMWENVNYWQRAIYLVVMVIACSLTVLPWIITFYNYTGQIGFTTASLYSFTDGIKPFTHIEAGKFLYNQHESWTSLSDILLSYFDTFIKHPFSTIYLILVKSIKCWYGTDSGRFESIMIFTNIPILILFLISLVRIVKNLLRKTKNQNSTSTLAVIFVIAGFVLGVWLPASILSLPIFRYMTPIFPFAILIIFYNLFNPDFYNKSR